MRTLSKIHSRVLSMQRQRGFFIFGGGQRKAYQIQRGLRFRANATAWLHRNVTNTPADTNGLRKTYSMWVKRGALGSVQELISNYNATTYFWGLYFASDDRLCFTAVEAGTTQAAKFSSAVYRDVGAWMHVVLVTDTASATAEDRIQIWVNGTRITSWNTNTLPPINAITSSAFVAPSAGTWFFNLGRLANASNYLDGYLSYVVGVDGQALTPASFGQTDASGNWAPKDYAGTYGTNGFRLKFDDPTSLTTLMADSSGNGNNWTSNNISLTAGVNYDSMLDVPLGGGGAERGNYCTLNPLVRHVSPCVLFNGNLDTGNSGATSQSQNTSGTFQTSTPSYYELTAFNVGGSIDGLGFSGFAKPDVVYASLGYPGSVAGSFGCAVAAGQWYLRKEGGASTRTTFSGITNGDVMMIAYNPATGNAWFGKNGVWNGTGNPSTGANPDMTGLTWTVAVPSVSIWNDGSSSVHWNANFGQRPFAYTPPTGFKALHTGNLPDPAIKKPTNYVAVTTRTGNGTNGYTWTDTTAVPFTPKMTDTKRRDAVSSHIKYNALTSRNLSTNATTGGAAASAYTNGGVTALVSGGLTFGVGSTDIANVNASAGTYVDTFTKGGASTVTNNAGTISSQVCVDTVAGIALITYVGNGVSGATVGHGLGLVPDVFETKSESSGVGNWGYYHSALGPTKVLNTNSTGAATTTSAAWNNTAPTSSVMTLGSGNDVNASGVTYFAVARVAVAGFSSFGSYVGNSSADGPVGNIGLRPKSLKVKCATTGSTSWLMLDAARDTSNPASTRLFSEANNAEASGTHLIDFLANGYKVRNTGNFSNQSGDTYVYEAYAEAPFKYALAR